jgi:hypothetical protein
MRRAHSRSALFLGEVVLALLIFALSSAVCVGLLFRAYQISEASGDLNQAVFCAQSAAESFKADHEFRELVKQVPAGNYEVYYDGDWQPADKQSAVFVQNMALRHETGVLYADISMRKGSTLIYELTASAYEEGGR